MLLDKDNNGHVKFEAKAVDDKKCETRTYEGRQLSTGFDWQAIADQEVRNAASACIHYAFEKPECGRLEYKKAAQAGTGHCLMSYADKPRVSGR